MTSLYYVIIWNVIVFLIYGYDKRQAKKQRWRISEKFLLISALLFGAPGALGGMIFFRHKTKKWMFRIGVPILFILDVGIIIALYQKMLVQGS
ncbi:MAG: DUF1294 domain-containing protein [Peptostreptococcaceae bacterium]|nr:DUF1294 domain-containing protein [Peptostreptococcaceae bacterium]